MDDRAQSILDARKWLDGPVCFLDTETTGLENGDEVVSVAVVDGQGNVLLESYVKPSQSIPPEATAIHGITDEMVKDAPTLDELFERLCAALEGRTIVIYNAPYDWGMLRNSIRRPELKKWFDAPRNVRCAMALYAVFYGDWSDYFRDYRWQRLSAAASQCGLKVQRDQLHSARGDAELTRQIMLHIAE